MCQGHRGMLRVPSRVTAQPAAKGTAPKPLSHCSTRVSIVPPLLCSFLHQLMPTCSLFFCAVTSNQLHEKTPASGAAQKSQTPLQDEPIPIFAAEFGPAQGQPGLLEVSEQIQAVRESRVMHRNPPEPGSLFPPSLTRAFSLRFPA